MDIYTILGFLTGLCILFILCRIFIVPLKFMLKLLANSLIGAIILLIVNFAGSYFGFHIGLNFITILFVSILPTGCKNKNLDLYVSVNNYRR